jgi:2-polyprenyl-3-methyl-5-hydroxy-6-metoxy-1,4-benzoquinol methylase
MPNEKRFKIRTRFIGVRNVKEYRESIAEWVGSDDVVLEIGCEWGTTTALIARRAGEVIGTDVSLDCIRRARRQHPHIRFEVLDAFDVRAALDFGKQFTKVYIDMSGLSGYRSLLDVISMLTMYATVLRPKAIVVKSGALKHFASLCVPWRPSSPPGEGEGPSRDRAARPESAPSRD